MCSILSCQFVHYSFIKYVYREMICLGITEDNTKDKARDKGYNARDNALYYRLGLQCFRKVLGVFLKYVCNVLEMFWGCVCNVVGMRFQCCKIGF